MIKDDVGGNRGDRAPVELYNHQVPAVPRLSRGPVARHKIAAGRRVGEVGSVGRDAEQAQGGAGFDLRRGLVALIDQNDPLGRGLRGKGERDDKRCKEDETLHDGARHKVDSEMKAQRCRPTPSRKVACETRRTAASETPASTSARPRFPTRASAARRQASALPASGRAAPPPRSRRGAGAHARCAPSECRRAPPASPGRGGSCRARLC